jgi:arsenical-resistance protein 2
VVFSYVGAGALTCGLIASTGSSRGRGSRAAGWFQDFIEDQGDTTMQSLILLEGIRGWATGGEQYVDAMDGYVASAWEKKA